MEKKNIRQIFRKKSIFNRKIPISILQNFRKFIINNILNFLRWKKIKLFFRKKNLYSSPKFSKIYYQQYSYFRWKLEKNKIISPNLWKISILQNFRKKKQIALSNPSPTPLSIPPQEWIFFTSKRVAIPGARYKLTSGG